MTHTLLVPAMYNLCLLTPDFAQRDLSAWRIGGFGGAPMPEPTITRLAEILPGLKLMNAYGARAAALCAGQTFRLQGAGDLHAES